MSEKEEVTPRFTNESIITKERSRIFREKTDMEIRPVVEIIELSGISSKIIAEAIGMEYGAFRRKKNGTQDAFTDEQQVQICEYFIERSKEIQKKSKKLLKSLAP